MPPDALIRAALEARKNAYAPYSHYTVGAALADKDGHIHTGCNVENVSFSATCCAERTALFAAVSAGARDFTAIAVVGGEEADESPLSSFAMPCGICRQALAEFGAGLLVYVARSDADYRVYSLAELLPWGFGM
jgi:homotetrameric cytidine deaminase